MEALFGLLLTTVIAGFISYTAYSFVLSNGIPISYSYVYYMLREKKQGWLFFVYMLSQTLTVPALIIKYDASIVGGCIAVILLILALTRDYSVKYKQLIHMTAARTLVLLLLGFYIYIGHIPALLSMVCCIIMAFINRSCLNWWGGASIHISIILVLLI